MRCIRQFCRSAAAAIAVVGLVVFALASAAAAHTSLVDASPGPETTVGGAVHHIDLEFGGNVSGPGVSLRDPNGSRLRGEVSQSFSNRVSLVLTQPLSVPGRYWVDYAIVSTDGDRVDESFGFDFDPDAAEPLPLAAPGSGPSQLLLVTAGVALGFAVVGGFTWFQGRQRKSDR